MIDENPLDHDMKGLIFDNHDLWFNYDNLPELLKQRFGHFLVN